MRDLCPPESTLRRALARRVCQAFEAHGYQLVATPSFEHAEVLERGLDAVDRRDLLRFVEPESGEVALLRPDITPQIARVISTRLHDRPPPFRLYYEGTVFRRRRGRARRHVQIAQAGIECVGLDGPEADAEVIAIAVAVAQSLGLQFTIELKYPRIVRRALALLPESRREAAEAALLAKDQAALRAVVNDSGDVPAEAITALPELYGELTVLDDATQRLGVLDDGAVADLRRVAQTLAGLGVSVPLSVDLGELRGHAYYTGVGFDLLAEGPGRPVGQGGRYDELLRAFGEPQPATGFALDLDHLAWALERSGIATDTDLSPGVVALGVAPSAIQELRQAGLRVVRAPLSDHAGAQSYASAWGFSGVVQPDPAGASLLLAQEHPTRSTTFETPAALAQHLAGSSSPKR